MNEIINFDYTLQALEALKTESENVNREDKDSLENAKKALVKARTTISKKGKEYRDESNAYNKMVLAKEKEYLAVIAQPEEDIKQAILKLEHSEMLEVNQELLPIRRTQIEALEYTTVDMDDVVLLSIHQKDWQDFYQKEFAYSENKKKEIKEQAEREILIKEQAEKDLIERQEKEKAQKEQSEKEADEKLKADKEYQDFLSENNYNKETDIIVDKKIYRLVATFNK